MSNKESDEQPMDDSGKKSYGQPLDLAWSKSRSDKHSSDAANGDNITSNVPSSGSARPETSFDPVAELLSNVKKAPRRREIGRNPRIPFTTPQVRRVKKNTTAGKKSECETTPQIRQVNATQHPR